MIHLQKIYPQPDEMQDEGEAIRQRIPPVAEKNALPPRSSPPAPTTIKALALLAKLEADHPLCFPLADPVRPWTTAHLRRL